MKIKVCGNKYKKNLLQILKTKPDYIGFIFYKKSKRFVKGDFVSGFDTADFAKCKKVGVFVNASLKTVTGKIRKYKLDYVQLHGSETPEYCKELIAKTKIIKAFPVDEKFNFETLERYKSVCNYFLFDTRSDSYGGSGKKFDWNLLRKYKLKKPYFLSGGLSLDDLSDINNIKDKRLHALDINSKFEIKPGLKNVEEVNTFILKIRKNEK